MHAHVCVCVCVCECVSACSLIWTFGVCILLFAPANLLVFLDSKPWLTFLIIFSCKWLGAHPIPMKTYFKLHNGRRDKPMEECSRRRGCQTTGSSSSRSAGDSCAWCMTVAYFCFHRSNTEQVPRETVVTAGLLGPLKCFAVWVASM